METKLYCEDDLIKVIDIDKNSKVAYLINTLLIIINRYNKIRIYIYNIDNEVKENG